MLNFKYGVVSKAICHSNKRHLHPHAISAPDMLQTISLGMFGHPCFCW
jgi:hypothetical protein